MLIPIVRNGVEKGGENFPQTGDVFIGGLADDEFENLKLGSKERDQFIRFYIGCTGKALAKNGGRE